MSVVSSRTMPSRILHFRNREVLDFAVCFRHHIPGSRRRHALRSTARHLGHRLPGFATEVGEVHLERFIAIARLDPVWFSILIGQLSSEHRVETSVPRVVPLESIVAVAVHYGDPLSLDRLARFRLPGRMYQKTAPENSLMRSMSPFLNPDISPTFAVTELPVMLRRNGVWSCRLRSSWTGARSRPPDSSLHVSKPK
ncbi:hypothetical protein WP1_147 [Pseudomonas phage WP1]